jgi:hypothetical protein
MKPDLSGIRLTVIELFGAFFPGLVWLVMVSSAVTFWQGHWKTPLAIVELVMTGDLAAQYPKGFFADKWAFGICVLLVATMLGLAVTKSGLIFELTELGISLLFVRDKCAYRERAFPYDAYWSRRVPGLLDQVNKKLEADLNLMSLPPRERFWSCKYFFKETSPHLWEDVERVEADVSFLCSLFGASLFGLSLAIAGTIHGLTPGYGIVFWLAACVVLANGYWENRHREPYLIYLLFLRTGGVYAQKTAPQIDPDSVD